MTFNQAGRKCNIKGINVEEISGKAARLGKKLQELKIWLHVFNDAEIAEIEEAVALTQRGCVPFCDLTVNDFPLPILPKFLEGCAKNWRVE